MDHANGSAPPVEPNSTEAMAELLRAQTNALASVAEGLRILAIGHQITHQVLGGIIRHLATGQAIKLPEQLWEAIGVEVKEAGSILVVPPGVKLSS